MRKEAVEFIEGLLEEKIKVHAFKEESGHIIEGVLKENNGYWYPIIRGIPCFLRGSLRPDFSWFQKKHGLPRLKEATQQENAKDQLATNITFSDKWRRFRNYGLEPTHQEFLFGWYCKKLGFSNIDELKAFYKTKEFILEVGPGSGFNTKFMAQNTLGQVFAVDISEAAFTTFENTKNLSNCHVMQADLMDMPFQDGAFDFIIADGVLHHTPNTKNAVIALYKKLKPGGQFFFHIYKKMGPARQFCDQYIRENFTKLDPEACYAACEGLTEMGRELSRLNATITLEKGIPILGVPPGKHNVQRLVYYNFVKCFWNDAFDYETNNMVNFDWYHPHNAWQHTEDEVEEWLKELGVKEYVFNPANPNGISALLTKPML